MNRTEKINVIEIYKTSFEYLKMHYKPFYTIQIAAIVLGYLGAWLFSITEKINPYLGVFVIIFNFTILATNILLGITLILAIRESIAEYKINIKQLFKSSRDYFWPNLINSVLLGISMILPILFVGIGVYIGVDMIRILFVIIGLSTGIFLLTRFGFAPLIPIVLEQRKRAFIKSSELVKGNMLQVIIVNIPYFVVANISILLGRYIDNKILVEGWTLFNLLIHPFFQIVVVVTILNLQVMKSPAIDNDDEEIEEEM